MEHVIVTGGLGFIGLNLIDELTRDGRYVIHNIDKMSLGHTYFDTFLSERQKSLVRNYFVDINERDAVADILQANNVTKVFHLAAESHVDRSISGPSEFFHSNVMGTLALAETCREFIAQSKSEDFRFLHVSTDEVFGDLGPNDPPFNETTPYNPSSPYSASKASSDFILKSWSRTYKFPAVITNCSNNFGPCQNTEKLLPKIISCFLTGQKIPIYGDGQNRRDWLFVKQHVAALLAIMHHDVFVGSYCIGGDNELSNLELLGMVFEEIKRWAPQMENSDLDSHIEFVEDRLGHDFRYAIDQSKFTSTFGRLHGAQTLEEQLRQTVAFYAQEHRRAGGLNHH